MEKQYFPILNIGIYNYTDLWKKSVLQQLIQATPTPITRDSY